MGEAFNVSRGRGRGGRGRWWRKQASWGVTYSFKRSKLALKLLRDGRTLKKRREGGVGEGGGEASLKWGGGHFYYTLLRAILGKTLPLYSVFFELWISFPGKFVNFSNKVKASNFFLER